MTVPFCASVLRRARRPTRRVRRAARFLFSVKRDASFIRRDRREDAVRDLFLTRSVESRYPDNLVSLKTRSADRRKKLRQETLRAQKGGASFLSWQYECGEKGDGERE